MAAFATREMSSKATIRKMTKAASFAFKRNRVLISFLILSFLHSNLLLAIVKQREMSSCARRSGYKCVCTAVGIVPKIVANLRSIFLAVSQSRRKCRARKTFLVLLIAIVHLPSSNLYVFHILESLELGYSLLR